MIENKISSIYIIISGIVQGVGFRPFVSKLADFLGVKGKVFNSGGAVEIFAEGEISVLNKFVRKLEEDAPLNSKINDLRVEQVAYFGYPDFRIIESNYGYIWDTSFMPSDLPVCEDCLKELHTKGNRRYRHPFISCASCGPRYSIIDTLPYDRRNTSMVDFQMCDECSNEYASKSDRRYHAETLSCHNCGPFLIYKSKKGTKLREEAFLETVKVLTNGGIVAIKGVGGYHFACSPFKKKVAINIRNLKRREEKPFAVMFPNLEVLKDYCLVSEQEANLLNSQARPIVLLLRKQSNICKEVYKDSRFLGAFLPYTPLQHMLLEECGALVMTSANLTGSPIIKDDKEILDLKSEFLDGVLYNERDIRVSLDDTVSRVVDGNDQIIRFSRGYAPIPVMLDNKNPPVLLATGGDLKASFCILKNGNAFISQYIGDLENEQIYKTYENSVEHLIGLLRVDLKVVVSDMHPNYFSSSFAEKTGLPRLLVQHHFAHIASVMAEHKLTEPVIGVAFDGTGYGDDGAVWGGEFLVCNPLGYERKGHLQYTVMCGGDTLSKDGWRPAFAHLYASGLEKEIRDERFNVIKAGIDNNINTVKTSSMGRLFDSISFILGLSNSNDYEGQSAIILENMAYLAKTNGLSPYPIKFNIHEHDGMYIAGITELLTGVIDGVKRGVAKEQIALGFHEAVANMVLEICIKIRNIDGINFVALSGGVFQNIILFERCLELLRENNFVVYYNKAVPPNDGGICLGQAYIGANFFS